MSRWLPVTVLFLAGCAGASRTNAVVEEVVFPGARGDARGRECYARVRNATADPVTVEVRFRFLTVDGKPLLEPQELWTRVDLGPGESQSVRTKCPFSSAARAELLVR